MYERNAIVIDRHFSKLFGYDQNCNLKNNATNYFELVNKLEIYQKASETENNVMIEFENIANQIKETQKLQEVLNKRNEKYCENRKALFDNLEEDADILETKFRRIDEDITKNDEEIKLNTERFVEEIREFHIKSEIRTECGRERRDVESDYQKKLNYTSENFKKINKERLKEIKAFAKSDNKSEEKQKIREEILKNGAKEKVPFDSNVINKAIDAFTDVEEKKVEILLSLYDKTGKLLDEIKNDNVKIERHKKIVRDSKSKLEYLNAINEYIILFLDNERMNTVGGEGEHEKIMLEACENTQKDLIQIQNMYSLLLKEITDKSSKKAYRDLYNLEYLFDLQDGEEKFEESISKLNMMGTVIYPEHWRIEGLQKIYETFKNLVTDVYFKDLTEFEPIQVTSAVNEDIMKIDEEEQEENEIEEAPQIVSNEEIDDEEELEENSEIDKQDDESEEDEYDEDDIFQWDDDDENEELNFDDSVFDNDEEDSEEDDDDNEEDSNEEEITKEDKIEEDEDEDEKDKEIDKILGFFDEEDSEEDGDELLELDDLDDDELEDFDGFDDEKLDELEGIDDFDSLDEDSTSSVLDDKKDNKSKESKKGKKKMSLFGRRKK